jgi:DNA-directed RNA polymerase subunit RPC12/RpoP
MEQKSSAKANDKMVVRCPICELRIMDVQSGSKPLKPNALDIVLELKCSRCGKKIQIVLSNA